MKNRFGELFTRAQKLGDSAFHGWLCHAFGAFSVNAGENAYEVISRCLEKLEKEAAEEPKALEEEA